ncbi:hypothetical protein M3Y97_00345600 [Aphelenchoides bicaudatus]|nr:hypothetical protein M3Y97_00345600 [Aphelenchoides bicaudatus]
MESRVAEERWRAGVVKNKLSLALGSGSIMGGGQPASPTEMPLGYRIARLNGPIGQRAIDMAMSGALPSIASPRSIDAKMSPTSRTIGDTVAKRRQGTAVSDQSGQGSKTTSARLKHSASAGSLLPELKARDDMVMIDGQYKSVRFLPPRVRASRHPKIPTKFMPLSGKTDDMASGQPTYQPYDHRFPRRGVAGDRAVSSRRFGQVGTFKQKAMLSRADQGIPTTLGNTQVFARRTKQWDDLPEVSNPPPTAMGPIFWANQGCQTDDLLVFDETFEPLIREMVNGAIIDARRSLLENEELQRMENQNKELLKIVVSEKQKNTELAQNIQQQTEIQKTLEAEMKSAEFVIDALEYRKLASEMLEDMTDTCLNRLMDRAIIKEDKFRKDVAADTRQLEKESKEMQRIMDEVENDFFPYVYQKAERVFIHTLADSFLKDALFSNNDQFREEAHERLNQKIIEYNKMLRRARPGQETNNLSQMLNRTNSPSTKIIDDMVDLF